MFRPLRALGQCDPYRSKEAAKPKVIRKKATCGDCWNLERVVFSSLLRGICGLRTLEIGFHVNRAWTCGDRVHQRCGISSRHRKQTKPMVTTTAEGVSGFLGSWLLRSSPFNRLMNHEERSPLSWTREMRAQETRARLRSNISRSARERSSPRETGFCGSNRATPTLRESL